MQNMQNVIVDNKINIWEWIEQLRAGWRWLVSGLVVGLLVALGFIIVTPSQYEATVVIQPATIGLTSATPSAVEPIEQTLERLKLVGFYNDDMVKACQLSSAKELAGNVKASLVKNSKLLFISYRAKSTALAKTCIAKIVEQLTQSQAMIAAPLIKELEEQRAFTKKQIDEMEQLLALNEKQVTRSPTFNESSTLLLLNVQSKREELTRLQKLYREQRVQLTEPLTQPLKPLEPIFASDKATHPKKLFAIIGGLIGGLFVGVLALFTYRGWRRFKSLSS